jgi:hypothetical protein
MVWPRGGGREDRWASMAPFHRRRAEGAMGGQRDLAGEISVGGGEVGVVDVLGVGAAAAEIAGEAGSGESDAEAEHGALWTPTLQAYRVVEMYDRSTMFSVRFDC